MADAFQVRLQALGPLVQNGAVPDAEMHTNALKTELEACLDSASCDWVKLSSDISTSAIPGGMKATLLTTLADRLKQRTNKRRPMQDFSAIWMLLPKPVWERFKQQQTAHALVTEVAMVLVSFGCRCPNERTKASIARVAGEFFQTDANGLMLLVGKDWKRVARKASEPVEWADTLPTTVELFKKAYPKLFETIACYKLHGEEAAQAQDFVNITDVSSGAALMPLRSRLPTSSPGSCRQLALQPATQGSMGIGMTDMMGFARGLTEMISKQHMSLLSQMQSMQRSSSSRSLEQLQLEDDNEVNPLPPLSHRGIKRKALAIRDKDLSEDAAGEAGASAAAEALADEAPSGEGGEAGGDGKCVDAASDLLEAMNARKAKKAAEAAAAKKAAAAAVAASSAAVAATAKAAPKALPKGKAKASAVAKGKAKAAAKPKGHPKKGAPAAAKKADTSGGYASANAKRQVVEARKGSGAGSSKCFAWATYGGKLEAMTAAYKWLSES